MWVENIAISCGLLVTASCAEIGILGLLTKGREFLSWLAEQPVDFKKVGL
jgi:hypothetical protein